MTGIFTLGIATVEGKLFKPVNGLVSHPDWS